VNQIYPVSLGISPSISAIAGFVKPGESLEEALVRKAKEETGIMVQASTLEANRGLFPIIP
jgi:8-oxo-dGTP pyrophosphatase MutT (NUDIX family)